MIRLNILPLTVGTFLYMSASLAGDFGTAGIATTDFASDTDYISSIAIQSDGKIVSVGTASNSGSANFGLARYDTDGSLDTDFSSDGKLTTSIGGTDNLGYAVAIQSDGKILMAGSSHNGSNWDIALVRYNANGSLDTDFSSDGIVTTEIGSSHDFGRSIVLQSDGKILVGGDSEISGNRDFAVVRYDTDGSLDTDFSSDGKLTTSIGSADEYGRSVIVQSDGKILLAGSTDSGSNTDFAVVRYDTDGSLDTDFSSDGIVTTEIGNGNDYSESVVLQASGKIIVSGYADMDASASTDYDVAVVRYNTDGSLDTDFDSDGIVTTDIGNGHEYGYDAAIMNDGNIVVAGSSDNGSNADFALVRYIESDGSLPIDLASFTSSTSRSNTITLHWVTESETENLGFTLERRKNKFGWLEIANYLTHTQLIGQGSITHRTEYHFDDRDVELGNIYDYRLADISYHGDKVYHQIKVLDATPLNSPFTFEVDDVYPNPFNPIAIIKYVLPETTTVKMVVYDIMGNEIITLINQNHVAGWHELEWHGKNWQGEQVESGTYFARLQAGSNSKVIKMVYLK